MHRTAPHRQRDKKTLEKRKEQIHIFSSTLLYLHPSQPPPPLPSPLTYQLHSHLTSTHPKIVPPDNPSAQKLKTRHPKQTNNYREYIRNRKG
jgi:hypothetical protein